MTVEELKEGLEMMALLLGYDDLEVKYTEKLGRYQFWMHVGTLTTAIEGQITSIADVYEWAGKHLDNLEARTMINE